jgi:hypothetical protein
VLQSRVSREYISLIESYILLIFSRIGECVPIRLFLSHLDLTPTYRSVNNVFSVKYYLNLVLVDEEDRRYFKQQEVVFWRKNTADNSDAVVGGTHRGLRSAPDRMVTV